MRFKAAYRQRMKMLALNEAKREAPRVPRDQYLYGEALAERRRERERQRIKRLPDTAALGAYFR